MQEVMNAVAFQRYGGAEVLEAFERPIPPIEPDGVLIRVAAAGVNPADAVMRSGGLKYFARIQFPFIPGLDVAGVVERVGAQVTRFRPGDSVYAMLPNTVMGGYAEYAAVAEHAAAQLPADLPMIDAAAIPCAALTALQGLRDHAQVKPGTRVLINGASGGVGSFSVQIAKALGAHVTAVTSARNLDLVKGLGADEGIDYTRGPLRSIGSRFNVVFDAVGLLGYRTVQTLLERGGVGVTVNPLRGNPIAQVRARLAGRRWTAFFVKPSGSDLEMLNGWLADGRLRAVIDRCYPLDEAAEAQRYSETKRVRGKIVLVVDNQTATPKGAAV